MKTANLGWLLASAVVMGACSTVEPEVEPVTFTAYASHERITTPGNVTFTVASDKPLTRVEIYEGARKVGESIGPDDLHTVVASVTGADNGERRYIAKGYDAAGTEGSSDPMSVEVDIRWSSLRMLEGSSGIATAFDATGAVYITRLINEWPNLDLSLAKYDSDGRQLWIRTFGGPLQEYFGTMGVAPGGRVHLAGNTAGTQGSECFLVVYEASGGSAWVQTAPTSSSTTFCAAASDAAGNYYLVGLVAVSLTRADLFLAKFDPNGTLLWMREHEREGEQLPSVVFADLNDGVYVSGTTRAGVPENFDALLMKFDAQGNRVWATKYGGSDWDIPTALTPDPQGGLYVIGYTSRGSDNPGFGDAFIARYASGGDLLWDRRFDGGSWDRADAVTVSQNAVYLVGTSAAGIMTPTMSEPRQGPSDAFLARLSRSGEMSWVRLLGGPQGDGGNALRLDTNGDVTIALGSGGGLPGIPNSGMVLARHPAP